MLWLILYFFWNFIRINFMVFCIEIVLVWVEDVLYCGIGSIFWSCLVVLVVCVYLILYFNILVFGRMGYWFVFWKKILWVFIVFFVLEVVFVIVCGEIFKV